MTSLKERIRRHLDDRKTPYPNGTRRRYFIGGLIALAIPFSLILLGYLEGAYDGPGEWVFMFVTPWHLLTFVGLYYVATSFVIREKGKKRK